MIFQNRRQNNSRTAVPYSVMHKLRNWKQAGYLGDIMSFEIHVQQVMAILSNYKSIYFKIFFVCACVNF